MVGTVTTQPDAVPTITQGQGSDASANAVRRSSLGGTNAFPGPTYPAPAALPRPRRT